VSGNDIQSASHEPSSLRVLDVTVSPSSSISPWTLVQYRILKRLAPGEPTHMDGSAYANRSKLEVLLGKALLDEVRDRDVLDFGCGSGTEAVELARVARSVYGLDISQRAIGEARARAKAAGLESRCTFGTQAPSHKLDVIVSLDSFEHFNDPGAILTTMFDLLRPGGRVVSSFGPTWFHPYGGHLFSVFPWAHLVFTERALIRWRDDIRSDGATRFHEVEGGLNRMTIARFERLVGQSRFRIAHLEAVPIRRLARLHNRLTREFTSAIVRCILERPA
jgi:SAM-dependent methyltransferase